MIIIGEPQPGCFIPLYERVRNVADHRVQQLSVVLLKLSPHLTILIAIICECEYGYMTKCNCHCDCEYDYMNI